MSAIAAEIILGLVEAGASLISSGIQSKQINDSQKEARELNEMQMAETKAARLANERLGRAQLALQSRQLAENTRLTEKQLGIEQELNARKSFRDQVTRLTSILESNEGLKSLYINRLRSLRSAA